MRLKRNVLMIAIWILAISFIWPKESFAHATLVEAVPAPDSHLETSPSQVVLTFNERVEKSLFYIRVVGTDGKRVTDQEAIISDDQRQISLDLPPLPDGVYTITYKVISADGHPVGGSYIIRVGEVEWSSASPGMTDLHAGHHSGEWSIQLVIVYTSRVIFFMSFLLLLGWVFWNVMLRHQIRAENKVRNQRILFYLKWAFFGSTFLMMVLHLADVFSDWNIDEFVALWFGTNIGFSFIGLITLSILSFFILQKALWLDCLWMGLVLIAKSINGHAAAFDTPVMTILLDIVHLFAASIWAGGLLYLLVFWKSDREHAVQFLPRFSQMALYSIIALVLTGSIYTFLFVPQISFLFTTTWGKLLVAKVVVVLFVIGIGALLRWQMKKQHPDLTRLLSIDFSAMMVITMIVGLITYMNPLPVNEPFYWHEMGQEVHMTAKIHPKKVGDNQFTVEVWVDEQLDPPKNAQMFIKYKPDEEMYPIEVPLELTQLDTESIFGFTLYIFKGEGAYLPFAGTWELEVRVMLATDDEKVYTNEFTIYSLN